MSSRSLWWCWCVLFVVPTKVTRLVAVAQPESASVWKPDSQNAFLPTEEETWVNCVVKLSLFPGPSHAGGKLFAIATSLQRLRDLGSAKYTEASNCSFPPLYQYRCGWVETAKFLKILSLSELGLSKHGLGGDNAKAAMTRQNHSFATGR